MTFMMLLYSVRNKWNQGQVTCSFNGTGKLALLFGGRPCDPPGKDFALFVQKTKEQVGIFIIDVFVSIKRKILLPILRF